MKTASGSAEGIPQNRRLAVARRCDHEFDAGKRGNRKERRQTFAG